MANIQLTGLDFHTIKDNFKLFLMDQGVLTDANYEGSALSILLDILAMNTHYNGYYLNMAVNEMFLDTAVKRNSIFSIAKTLGYVPSSTHSCQAILNITFNGVTDDQITIPKYTKFISKTFDVFYTFVTNETLTADVNNGKAVFENVSIIEGEPVMGGNGIRNIYRSNVNPRSAFLLPDANIDLNTLEVVVQNSTIDFQIELFNPKEDFQTLDENSNVYFIEESSEGFYEIYFGDGVLGKKLEDGNVVYFRYLISSGVAAEGGTDFKIISDIPGNYKNYVVKTISPASGGKNREDVDSIKFAAPKYFSAQNRAVSYQDYISALTNNAYNISFDSVNVWGGQENDPPIYGKVFMAVKPTGSYTLTIPQKELIKTKVIKPISVVTVDPEIVDPDYTFIKVVTNVVYDSNKTLLDKNTISDNIRKSVLTFADTNLNSFNSIFSYPDLMYTIQNADPSIVTNECLISLEKKIIPVYQTSVNYEINFGCELERGLYYAGITSYPGLTFLDKKNSVNVITGIFIEEVPSVIGSGMGGITQVFVTNRGYNYQTNDTKVVITGDGEGATANAVIVNNSIRNIVITNAGRNYTYVNIEIVSGSGRAATAIASVTGKYGTLRLVYFNSKKEKVIYDSDIGYVDYQNGIVYLEGFNPVGIDETNNPLKQVLVSAKPKSNIIYSSRNRIYNIRFWFCTYKNLL